MINWMWENIWENRCVHSYQNCELKLYAFISRYYTYDIWVSSFAQWRMSTQVFLPVKCQFFAVEWIEMYDGNVLLLLVDKFIISVIICIKQIVCLPGECRRFGISVDCDRFTWRPGRPGDLRSLRVLLYLRRLFGDGDRLEPVLEPDCDVLPHEESQMLLLWVCSNINWTMSVHWLSFDATILPWTTIRRIRAITSSAITLRTLLSDWWFGSHPWIIPFIRSCHWLNDNFTRWTNTSLLHDRMNGSVWVFDWN